MAIEWMDDFESYGTDEDFLLDGLYASNGGATLVASPDSNEPSVTVLGFTSTLDAIRRVLSGSQTTVGIACRMWIDGLPSGTLPDFFRFQDANNRTNVTFNVTSTGAVQAWRGNRRDSGVLLGETSGPVLTAGAFQHIEAKVVIDASSGEVEFRVEGVPVIEVTGINTVASAGEKGSGSTEIDGGNASVANCAQVILSCAQIGAGDLGMIWYTKDLICWNGTGSYNNDFIGTCHVERLVPASDVSLNWAPSTGSTGFDLIGESPPNDSDYILADATPPAAAVMTLTDLSVDVTTVKGLMSLVRATKTDGGDGNLQVSLRSNGSDDDGADRAITTSETYWFDISEEDPDTASAWTPAAVNAASIVFNRTI